METLLGMGGLRSKYEKFSTSKLWERLIYSPLHTPGGWEDIWEQTH